MRKFTFLLGVVMMTSSLAFATSNYRFEEADGTYTYTGTTVTRLSVNFTEWGTSDLPSPFTDNMAAEEKSGMAFVKWKIANRSCGDKGTVNALFNNNAADFGNSPINSETTNPPRIYLPTTSGSVGNITVYAGAANAWLKVFYKDADHASWTQASSIPTVSDFGERSIALNSKGQTSIYLEYVGTQYICITNLDLEIASSSYVCDLSKNAYSYVGDPVDSLKVDFTEWLTSDLPSALTDNMTAAEKGSMAFVKWKIGSRACGEPKGTVYALFNNNTADAGVTIANNADGQTNPPRIYLPTTSTGVTNIKVHGLGNVSLGVRYKDAKHSTWNWAGSLALPSSYGEASLALNTDGKTSIYLEYANTPYPTITDLQVETKYIKNTTTNLYEYRGDPVDAINLDFTSWYAGYLPSTLSDDMPLAEMSNVGFVKWKINSVGGYSLYNNDNADWSGTAETKNNATSNPPTIYFPTTVRGIESIAITYTAGSAFNMRGTYTDAVRAHSETIAFPKALSGPDTTVIWNVGSAGQTKLYIQYFNTVWPRIKSIVFTIKDTENTSLGLWDYTTSTGNNSKLEAANGQVRDVYIYRSFEADGGYYTLCLPFDLTAGQVASAFGDCKLAKLSSSEMRGTLVHLTFDYVNTIEAGVPYLFLPSADIADCAFSGVTIDTDASREINTTYFKMTGIYNPTSLSDGDFYMGEDNYLLPVTSDEPLRPFRSYFTVIEPVPMGVRARVMFAPEHTTDIEFVQSDNVPYTKELRDGHLYIRRGETVYTISGQIVK